jgi:CheY-like chemotaxis protein
VLCGLSSKNFEAGVFNQFFIDTAQNGVIFHKQSGARIQKNTCIITVAATRRVSRKPLTRSKGPMRHILVVDDEAELRRAIGEALEQDGWLVTEAESGDEALGLLKAGERFDTLVTDVRMPGVTDGLDLARFVCRSHKNMTVIVMSGYTGWGDNPVIAEQLGSFLAKPFIFTQLRRLVGSAA